MGTQLAIELYELSCGDLVRFVDALRACGVSPETEIEHVGSRDGSAPRLQVSWRGTAVQSRMPVSGPPGAPAWRGVVPPRGPAGSGRPYGAPMPWEIQISFPGGVVGRHTEPAGFGRWHAALSEAIALPGLSEASRAALVEIQQLLDPRDPSGGRPWMGPSA